MCAGLLPQGVGSIGQRSDWSNVDICLARDLGVALGTASRLAMIWRRSASNDPARRPLSSRRALKSAGPSWIRSAPAGRGPQLGVVGNDMTGLAFRPVQRHAPRHAKAMPADVAARGYRCRNDQGTNLRGIADEQRVPEPLHERMKPDTAMA